MSKLSVEATYDSVTNTVMVSVGGFPAGSVPGPSWVDASTFRDVGFDRAETMEEEVCAEALASALGQLLERSDVSVTTDR